MRLIENIIGSRQDPDLSERLHRLEHRGVVDTLSIRSAEIQRRRFRATTAQGRDVAIALPRGQSLSNGSVLLLEPDYALIVCVETINWIRFVPRDTAAAVELGYSAGNLHWRVKFDGDVLLVAKEGPLEGYLARLAHLRAAGRVTVEEEPRC